MSELLQVLNDIFESKLTINDVEKEVQEVLPWDSFHIMNFLVEMEERFNKKVTIEHISEVYYIQDLLQFIKN